MKITRLETFLVKPRALFLKMHTDEGIVGLGEPILEGRAETCAMAVREMEPYLIGQDPRRVVHHWHAIYRHAFYRGGPLLTSAQPDEGGTLFWSLILFGIVGTPPSMGCRYCSVMFPRHRPPRKLSPMSPVNL